MIRPVAFHKNDQTAQNNYYQHEITGLSAVDTQSRALDEFDQFVDKLRSNGIDVTVINDTVSPDTPDSIFPNNWISFHQNGLVIVYPMFAPNRRQERRADIIETIKEKFEVRQTEDFAYWEDYNKYLEGTGSMILDRVNKKAYAALSDRTNSDALSKFGSTYGYQVIAFTAYQSVEGNRLPIYHTNVMMCIGEGFAAICLDSIDDPEERAQVVDSLTMDGKEIIELTEEQNNSFAGNMLQLINDQGERLVVMSSSAYHSLNQDQTTSLKRHGNIVHSDLSTIETLGGGSARCMMAEVFLPYKNN